MQRKNPKSRTDTQKTAPLPPTPTPKRGAPLRLTNIEDVLRELRSIYRSAKDGSRDVAKATKLAYLLQLMATMIRDNTLEERIAALEKRLVQPKS